jgi:LysR family hydrogen peroxide-inducible transcriptional activator
VIPGLSGAGMETHQAHYFLALFEEKHFGRAARRSGIAQPSLTKAIRKLEAELGGVLFHRTPKVELTELGRALQPYLRRIVRNVEGARRKATRVNGVAINSGNQLRSARSDAISVT